MNLSRFPIYLHPGGILDMNPKPLVYKIKLHSGHIYKIRAILIMGDKLFYQLWFRRNLPLANWKYLADCDDEHCIKDLIDGYFGYILSLKQIS